ncbi:galactokinase [Acidipila sp. EB88]|uniref:galactokinase n=1 Tax=Acidipila sp. EB88 TaxID=2305226 RepID=UPI001F3B1FA3|nr:galactokinase [Acidipila sp. EB88]
MDTAKAAAELAATHQEQFGEAPIGVFAAPGRVNLIGEHTDYAGGFVMPAAIDFATVAAVSRRMDGVASVYSVNFDKRVEFALDAVPPKGSHEWSDYPFGVLEVLRAEGIDGGLGAAAKQGGFSLSLFGDVPLGAGLSSSASIEVATMLALLAVAGVELPGPKMALLAQRAENTYVGANCGIMDQFIACCGKRDSALLLDCRSLESKLAPIPTNLSLVICNTMVKHSHAGGEYNTRRAEVEQATATLRSHRPEIALLRDATPADLEQWGHEMPLNVLKRARHIITDSLRAEAAAAALERGDLEALGQLMAEAHASYRDDFEASCPEADLMVELANQQPGLVGARLTGGGFGGCTVNLVEEQHARAFGDAVAKAYEQQTGIKPDVFQCHASDGAKKVL